MSDIIIKGAREHNLCDVNLVLPRNKLICFTGVSGSGKSSLAFDTLYAEGQRRYVESLSSYARQFLGQLPKPDVDQITGLSPAISISQKAGGQNSRSTVGTITEVYDFLRILFARIGVGYCPKCQRPITAQTRQQIIDRIETLPEKCRFLVLAPVIRGQKGEHRDLFADLLRQGYLRARVDGNVVKLSDDLKLDRQMRHNIELVIDRLEQTGAAGRSRLAEAVERALAIGDGHIIVAPEEGMPETADGRRQTAGDSKSRRTKHGEKNSAVRRLSSAVSEPAFAEMLLSAHYACTHCGINFEPPSPQLFSFNTPRGMCPKCDGLGEIHSFAPDLLIPDPSKSFQQGCVEPLGRWRDLGRWKRHIFQGVADFLEKQRGPVATPLLETAWEELDPEVQQAFLWGTGEQHITFTWRGGTSAHKWGGKFEGIIPKMLQQYRESKSKMQRAAMEKYMRVIPCGYCHGERLNEQARSFRLETTSTAKPFAKEKRLSLPQLCNLSIRNLNEFFSGLHLSESGQLIASEALKEIRSRLGFLMNVGLDYLTLGRTAPTLSGGEMQRIRLASQIGSGLVGVLYILDEPSIGLHPRDNDRLLATLAQLRDLGNTVIVVEHDEDTMRAADCLVDFGPGPGLHGGHIVARYENQECHVPLGLRSADDRPPRPKPGGINVASLRDDSIHSETRKEKDNEHDSDGYTDELLVPDGYSGSDLRDHRMEHDSPGLKSISAARQAVNANRIPTIHSETRKEKGNEHGDRSSRHCDSDSGRSDLRHYWHEHESVTLKYLSGEESIPIPTVRRAVNPERILTIQGAEHNNLKNVDVEIPLGTFVCITGVSGSGKSSLVNDILAEALNRDLNRGYGEPGKYRKIEGIEHLDKMIDIDQSPIGRGPHSNPATYIKVFDEIRALYAELPESKAKGYAPGRFSFNVKGGRCEACEGRGTQRLEMDFLADIYVTCPSCNGLRFNQETLAVRYKGKSITQVLEMDVEEALEHFENIPKIKHYLTMLQRVGLSYMKLGQPSPTLSGGEAQRIKLARELVKRSTGKTLYLLDEPTTGLHFADIRMLLAVLHDFVEAGNTVLVVEHNLDVIKTADWVIDLGPEGGEAGGEILVAGTPEDVIKCQKSYTGISLQKHIGPSHRPLGEKASVRGTPPRHFAAQNVPPPKEGNDSPPSEGCPTGRGGSAKPDESVKIVVKGAEQHNLKNINVEIERHQMTVCCGPSGSGKSSLAMDTIYAEGQRRYVESLSSYARQFIGQMQKPKVEHISGLSPAIAIEQKAASHSPRSTVGTITEIQDYLRVLFARLGVPYCPHCNIPIGTQTLDEIIARILNLSEQGEESKRYLIAAPLLIEVGQLYDSIWKRLQQDGFARVRIDGQTYPLEKVPEIDRRRKHDVELIVDRLLLREDQSSRMRLADSVETALGYGQGVVHVILASETEPETNWKVYRHSLHLACESCGRSFERLTPHHFSSNSSLGWCPHCEGLGVQQGASPMTFLRDPKLTLAQGAVALWPDEHSTLFKPMLAAFSKQTGIPLDLPFEQLDARHRRLIYHGTGETWFEVRIADSINFSFQYKGVYPAMEEAVRLVPSLRGTFDSVIGEVECGVCMGSRLRADAAAVRLIDRTMDQICRMPLDKLYALLESWQPNETERQVAGDLLFEVKNRLRFLLDVGLAYLTLARSAPTLSGGEIQRIRLAAQIGSGLVGVLYVLDEPTIGLHPRDNRRLIDALKKLRDLGNTLLLVEHDREVIASADHILDFGPQAGKNGGEIVASGSPKQLSKQKSSVTGPYLGGKKAIPIPRQKRI